MKKTGLMRIRFTPAFLVVLAMTSATLAQTNPSSSSGSHEVNVRIIDRNGDAVREVERTYHVNGLTDDEREKLVTKLVDSLKATRKDNERHQLTIIVDDHNGNRATTRSRTSPNLRRAPSDAYTQRDRQPNNSFFWNDHNWSYELRRGADSMADQLRRIQLPKDIDRQFARPFEDWSRNFAGRASTIRGLEAFPNNPDRDQLTIRFTAPAKGDVTVLVTNTKGKEIAKREISNFSGDFVGQIDLGKKAQGTYFVTVTQNEDGAVKRIVVE